MRGACEPFEWSGDDLGVLCIHGFTGTPYEVRHLASRLHQRGRTVFAPLLPGHGTRPDELDRTTWLDWFRLVNSTFDRLRERCTQVCVAGQSLGGLLALELLAERKGEIAAAAALATPLWLGPLGAGVIGLGRRLPTLPAWLPTLPKLGGHSDVRDRRARRENPCYRVLPLRGMLTLAGLMDRVRGRLAEIERPLLVLHGQRDHTAPPACARYLAEHVSSPEVRLRMLPRSFHLIAQDVERDVVAAEVAHFFDKQTKGTSACAT